MTHDTPHVNDDDLRAFVSDRLHEYEDVVDHELNEPLARATLAI
jgi:hypothetical protein